MKKNLNSTRHSEDAKQPKNLMKNTQRFFGRSRLFNLNRKFNANPLNDGNNIAAFTLAEVLITLTIIGVIAAITIPNLMQTWRKHERITQIKTAYSIISQAVKMSIAENGSPADWDSSTINIAEKYIMPYLKIQYACGRFDKVLRKGCFLTSETNPTGYFHYPTGSTNEGAGTGYGANYIYNMKLQNGMDLGIHTRDSSADYISFIVDVNGNSGPTKIGVDVFGFILEIATGKVKLGYGSWYYPNQKLQTVMETYCQMAHVASLQCTRVLELNNWEFPDDYPVKKF